MNTIPKPKPNKPSARASGSCDSVKVTWLDAEAVREQVRRSVEAMVRQRPEVRRVLLFGSLAVEQAVPGSDADLLVVLSGSDRSFLDRIPLYTPDGCPVGVDVFPYTQAEMESLIAAGNWFLRRAFEEGVEIYTA